MHLVPAERAGQRTIDGHRVCDAIAAVGEPEAVRAWADCFSLLSDPGRLSLLLALHEAGPIAVSDLAIATGMRDTAVSQALRLLRTAGIVQGEKDGRIVRYRLVDGQIAALLKHCTAHDANADGTRSGGASGTG
ncbi:ArsR/SmtB family transcription factor [Streptomyces monashensis]|uniref:Transcriptional regulator n=1 Tax=Streptomyces monashensis TaxID=1678012 RepID=A0A1S2PYI6_9ACTN|nr:metalloregulator ArsR/SmtB family transcription factor [Streptomyces monashensis]OIJ98901.1 transcriptional regulator [Streptomyces monashensis]